MIKMNSDDQVIGELCTKTASSKKTFIRKVVIKMKGFKIGEVDIKGDRIRALPVVSQKAIAKVVRKTPTKTVPKASTVPHKPEAVLTRKLRELIQVALSKAMTEITMSYDGRAEVSDPAQIAASIESPVKNKKMGQNKNNAKHRSILFNLRDPNNPDLRRRVLLGEIKPEELIDMTAEEMASNKRKRENDEIRLNKSLMKYGSTRGADDEEGTTDQFRCGRCGERIGSAPTVSCRQGALMSL